MSDDAYGLRDEVVTHLIEEKMARKTEVEVNAENRLLWQYRLSEGLVSIINNLIRWGGLVAISYFSYRSVVVLSGHTTAADIGIKVLADVRMSEALAWALGGSGIAYGWRQRKLRHDAIERSQGRISALEKDFDPHRSSSALTRRGETRPEDIGP